MSLRKKCRIVCWSQLLLLMVAAFVFIERGNWLMYNITWGYAVGLALVFECCIDPLLKRTNDE